MGNPLVTVQGSDLHSTTVSTINLLLMGEEGVGPRWTADSVIVLHGVVCYCAHLQIENVHAKKLPVVRL